MKSQGGLLEMDLDSEQNAFRRSSSEANAIINASLRISQIIAKK